MLILLVFLKEQWYAVFTILAYAAREKYKKVAFGKVFTVSWKSDIGHAPVIWAY